MTSQRHRLHLIVGPIACSPVVYAATRRRMPTATAEGARPIGYYILVIAYELSHATAEGPDLTDRRVGVGTVAGETRLQIDTGRRRSPSACG